MARPYMQMTTCLVHQIQHPQCDLCPRCHEEASIRLAQPSDSARLDMALSKVHLPSVYSTLAHLILANSDIDHALATVEGWRATQ